MIFTAPLALLALFILPPLYLLLRLTPPAPRRLRFPPVALLRGLAVPESSPHHLPLWLLLLRLAALACLITGFAGPTLNPPPALPGTGPILLVVDNGWASAAHWPEITATTRNILAAAQFAHRGATILATARTPQDTPPRITGVMDAATSLRFTEALQPEPWPSDRLGAAQALQSANERTRIYLADGITDGAAFNNFIAALHPTRIYAAHGLPPLLGPPALAADGGIILHSAGTGSGQVILAESAAGHVLARAALDSAGQARFALPALLRRKIARFAISGPATAGGTTYTDASIQTISAGLAGGGANAGSPFLGSLYFLARALPPSTEITTGTVAMAGQNAPGVMILADQPLGPDARQAALAYIENGGILIRFAGPLTADSSDDLAADPLLRGGRRLGGALTWTTPEHLAPLPPSSPLAGMKLDPKITVSQQIIADPATLDQQTVWATLQDGTPLVIGKAMGNGYLINVLTSANTAWSDLAISGMFPEMLARLTRLSPGGPRHADGTLPIRLAMDAFGNLSATGIMAAINATQSAPLLVSASQPPGIYGTSTDAIALNLGGHVSPMEAANLPGAIPFAAVPASLALGPNLIALGILVLALDALASLILRGALPRLAILVILAWCLPNSARAQSAALQTHLGYLITNDADLDQRAASGLGYLSENTSIHTSVQLGPPAGLSAATDDLNLYPLIYWPLAPGAAPPAPAACAALAGYMSHGGLLVIDMPGGDAGASGSSAGFAPGADATFAKDTACLDLPPLQPLTPADVLAHCFFILQDFPGRFTGAPVLAAIPASRDADGVTPVIVSQNDWAGAWSRDPMGNPEQTPIPGGETQRAIADRFGINLVIYALTGSYKADQNTVPALLDRLGP